MSMNELVLEPSVEIPAAFTLQRGPGDYHSTGYDPQPLECVAVDWRYGNVAAHGYGGNTSGQPIYTQQRAHFHPGIGAGAGALSPFSLSFWMYADTWTPGGRRDTGIMEILDGATLNVRLMELLVKYWGSQTVVSVGDQYYGNAVRLYNAAAPPAAQWNHWMLSFTGGLTGSDIFLYVNGNQWWSSRGTNGTPAARDPGTARIRIGRVQANYASCWFDRLIFRKYAATQSEAKIEYGQGRIE